MLIIDAIEKPTSSLFRRVLTLVPFSLPPLYREPLPFGQRNNMAETRKYGRSTVTKQGYNILDALPLRRYN